ncbi:MAG: sel1 repeat family protein [Spirochaetaceae bacterium]|jgi:TPR repeat protein|nr:sel1 repeat family protein [Spirochaetaceae bacterium]
MIKMKKIVLAFLGILVITMAGPLFAQDAALLSLAESGDVSSMLAVADYYWNNEDHENATKWNLRIVEQPDVSIKNRAIAEFRIGRYYDVKGDMDNSVKWYTKASDNGDATAQLNLGNYYYEQGDIKKAFDLYMLSAEQGDPYAGYNVAVQYLNGAEGVVEKDDKKAVEWMQKAAAGGDPMAQYAMFTFYLQGLGGLPQDDNTIRTTAVDYLLASANAGYPEAEYAAFASYLQGLGGLEKNSEIALNWLLKAYMHGHEQAAATWKKFGLTPLE